VHRRTPWTSFATDIQLPDTCSPVRASPHSGIRNNRKHMSSQIRNGRNVILRVLIHHQTASSNCHTSNCPDQSQRPTPMGHPLGTTCQRRTYRYFRFEREPKIPAGSVVRSFAFSH
ncbi:unnamed protein product, partial [Ectocarpus fasciculatus]